MSKYFILKYSSRNIGMNDLLKKEIHLHFNKLQTLNNNTYHNAPRMVIVGYKRGDAIQ